MKKLLPNRKKQKPQIIITNLIDIILLLVFFFMITSSFARNTEKMPVTLPGATNAAAVEGENLTIQISKAGKIFSKKKQISANELKETVKKYASKAPNRSILVEADQDANYGRIIKILDTIRSAGGNNIGLSTNPTK